MLTWIKQHKIYTTILITITVWFIYIGYVNVWEPVKIIASTKTAAGESVSFIKETLEFLAQKDILDMLKTLLPILIPIYLFKKKHNMDTKVKQKTNYIVREKMGIMDRRKKETSAQAKINQIKYNRRKQTTTTRKAVSKKDKTTIRKSVKK